MHVCGFARGEIMRASDMRNSLVHVCNHGLQRTTVVEGHLRIFISANYFCSAPSGIYRPRTASPSASTVR